MARILDRNFYVVREDNSGLSPHLLLIRPSKILESVPDSHYQNISRNTWDLQSQDAKTICHLSYAKFIDELHAIDYKAGEEHLEIHFKFHGRIVIKDVWDEHGFHAAVTEMFGNNERVEFYIMPGSAISLLSESSSSTETVSGGLAYAREAEW